MGKKTTLIIALFVTLIIVGGIGFVAYLLLFADDPEEDEGFFDRFFDFGREEVVDDRDDLDPIGDDDRDDVAERTLSLREISEHPVALSGGFAFTRDGDVYVRYISRSEGRLYEVRADGSNHRLVLRNEEDAFTGAYEVTWIDENSFVAHTSSEGGRSFVVIQLEETEEGVVWSGTALPHDTYDIALSPNRSGLLYLRRTEEGTVGDVVSTEVPQSQSRRLFSLPLREIHPHWRPSSITLTTYPSGGTEGHMFNVNPQTGAITHALRNKEGLVTLPNPSGNSTLLATNERTGRPHLAVLRERSRDPELLSDISTFPEKCVWLNDSELICATPLHIESATHPDAWYQGRVSFFDRLFLLNTQNGRVETLLSFDDIEERYRASFDAINLFLSDDENYLFFTDKREGKLWVYDVLLGDDEVGETAHEEEEGASPATPSEEGGKW